jgi:hypothetical protein
MLKRLLNVKYPLKLTKKTFKYRSGLEETVINNLTNRKVSFLYEQYVVDYSKPPTKHKYTPDIKLDNGIFIEIKGFFKREDRRKHVLIKEQRPELDIRFIFGNSKNKIYKGSKTTYADWCEKNSFKYAEKIVPKEWTEETKKN